MSVAGARVVAVGPRAHVAVLALCLLSACASTPTLPAAAQAWRSGRRASALAMARAEVERFRLGNHLDHAAIDAELEAVSRWLDETPVALDEAPSAIPTDLGRPEPAAFDVLAGLRSDLASQGATRALRAIRGVMKLGLERFAIDLLTLAWRREPWQADTPRLAEPPTALRALVVKSAALDALEALASRRPPPPRVP